jgi:HAE1 family hydrophobic/amphiphilic exporter-1
MSISVNRCDVLPALLSKPRVWNEEFDFALEPQRAESKAPVDAITEGCLVRFRPIMMTTMAALMAALPIAAGLNGAARRPLGLTIVGGLLTSQLITLYLTPVFYLYMDALQQRLPRLGRFFRIRGRQPQGTPAS